MALGTAALVVTTFGPGVGAPASAASLYTCTVGATIDVVGSTATIVGQGSCLDLAGALHPLNFSGAGEGAVAICLPYVPIIRLPAMTIGLDMADQYNLTHQAFVQQWSELIGSPGLTGAPIYGAFVHNAGGTLSGLVAGLSISAAACAGPVQTQGPFVLTFLA